MLEQRSEGSVLEPCGRSCVPPPADMTQADLDRLSQENGIVWCQNCVQVGDLGQLCSLPTPDENGEAPQ